MEVILAKNKHIPAIVKKTKFGIPGIRPMPPIIEAVIYQTRLSLNIWLTTVSPIFCEADTRVTIIAVAVESNKDGICATSPSPMVNNK